MPADRVQMLKSLIQEDPNDPFLRYGLAMETAKVDPAEAVQLFDHILSQFPNYLPTYYQAAVLHIEGKGYDKAKRVLQAGIELAMSKGEMKTISELRTLLDQLD
ncbi:MAG: tetratricopeptide repeat protein [Cytophagales bacterium]